MRPHLLALLLLLLSLLFSGTQGIRWEKGFMSIGHQKTQDKNSETTKTTKDGLGDATIFCKDDDNCSGKDRKLMVSHSSSPSPPPTKNNENGGNKAEKSSKNGGGGGEGEEETFSGGPNQQYPDVMDLAGMDYTPARRKPPIHN